MATPAPQRDPRDNSDSRDENDPPRDIPLLYVPDLANTILSEAIKDSVQVGNTGTEYIIADTTTERHSGYRMTQGDITGRRAGNMFSPSSGLCHQFSTNTLQHTTTERCPEGHEKGQPRSTVPGR